MHINKRLAGVITAVIAIGGILAGCSHGSPNAAANGLSETNQVNQYGQVQPIPQFSYSQYRKALTDIEAAQVLGESGTAFFMQTNDPNPIFTCNMEGQPIPNTAQLSNPNATYPVTGNWGGGSDVLPQIDPNGVYTPTNSSGTYVLCRTSSGGTELTYWEGNVLSFLGPAKWNYTTHQAVVTGAPNMPTCNTTKVGGKPKMVCTK